MLKFLNQVSTCQWRQLLCLELWPQLSLCEDLYRKVQANKINLKKKIKNVSRVSVANKKKL